LQLLQEQVLQSVMIAIPDFLSQASSSSYTASACSGDQVVGISMVIGRRWAGAFAGFLEPIRFAFDGNDFRIVDESVDQRDYAGGVGEYLRATRRRGDWW
jgi:hypothetical protein